VKRKKKNNKQLLMNKRFLNFDAEDSISKYFKEVKKTNILTQEKEIALAIRIRNGDNKAVDELVSSNLKFVISVAKDYQNQGLDLQDLINEGNYGLIKAAHKFNHDRGFRFISYAVWWIKQSIIQSLNDNARVVRLPTNVINKINKLNKEISKFENKNEREPIYQEMLSDGTLMDKIMLFPKATSLNQVINEDGDELIELIQIEDEEDDSEIKDDIKNELKKTLLILDERERVIIQSYFGINLDEEEMTLEKIGEKYDLSKERIRQIKEKAIRKLRFNSSTLQLLIKN
jgi:RNA polymerase primary sigma factor